MARAQARLTPPDRPDLGLTSASPTDGGHRSQTADSGGLPLRPGRGLDDTQRMTLSTNEQRILGILADKDALEPADCARLAELGTGMTEAALRSLVAKDLAVANVVRKGLSKKPDGTYSITPAGRSALAA